MILYKDKECTTPAECPLSYINPSSDYINRPCNTDCAWCESHAGIHYCTVNDGMPYLFAKEEK